MEKALSIIGGYQYVGRIRMAVCGIVHLSSAVYTVKHP